MTDDGYTVRRLEKPGFGIPEDKKQILEQTTKRYHVMLQGNELTSYGSAKDFSSIIHSFIQCMIYVSCIWYLCGDSRHFLNPVISTRCDKSSLKKWKGEKMTLKEIEKRFYRDHYKKTFKYSGIMEFVQNDTILKL